MEYKTVNLSEVPNRISRQVDGYYLILKDLPKNKAAVFTFSNKEVASKRTIISDAFRRRGIKVATRIVNDGDDHKKLYVWIK